MCLLLSSIDIAYTDNITQYVYVNNIYWQAQQNRGLVKSNDFLNPSDIQGRS